MAAGSRTTLLDRVGERAAIDDITAAAQRGLSGVCVLHGDAGMGKTRLLEYAVDANPTLQCLWVNGVEAEKEFAYAALHRLLLPFLSLREELPEPQSVALGSAFGLHVPRPADRFLVGLACLTLLSRIASDRGVLCIIDDAHWIDPESIDALAFVGRRLAADRIALLFGARNVEGSPERFDGLPELQIGGLPDDSALELLSTRVPGAVSLDAVRRIMVEAQGCPLALTELASELTADRLHGEHLFFEALPIGRRLEEHFLSQARLLTPSAQTFLLIAAAETSGQLAMVRRAATLLGTEPDGEDAAVASGLIATGSKVEFRHPLIRSAVYAGGPDADRRRVHEALASLIDPTLDPDRRARHRAAAARLPDEGLARELEDAAARAGQRGGYAAEASFLVKAAQLTPEVENRAARLLRASAAALTSGAPARAAALLEEARPQLRDPLLRAEAMRLAGRNRFELAQPGSAAAMLLEAAREFSPIDQAVARMTMLEALDAALVSQRFTVGTTPEEIARTALTMPRSGSATLLLSDLLLEGTATLLASDYAGAVPILRQAAVVLRSGHVGRDDITDWCHVGIFLANELWDDQTYGAWAARVEKDAREHGALIALQFILLSLAKHEIRTGQFANAEACYAEVVDITRAIDGPVEFYELLKVDLSAWRGDEIATRRDAPMLSTLGAAIGSAQTLHLANLALATLALGSRRYDEALAAALRLTEESAPGWTCQGLHVAIEAAVRSGHRTIAEDCVQRLADRATVTQTDWALGQLARSRALLAQDHTAEPLYEEAITHLARTSVATELAQAHLVYGEWLRRQNRKVDAREHLRTAYEQFQAMGAVAFASRARTELAATGERARKRTVETANDLTPQEHQIAALAASGATNSEIGAQLFISANTVDFHLRKIFRKLQITSRRQLRSQEQVLR